MARPSQNLDRALLEAGIEEIRRGGVRGLSVRAVCARAGVNLRMLNYYFGSKDDFVRLLLTKTYEHFFHILQEGVSTGGTPLERLRQALRISLDFTVRHREITRSLWMDANAGEPLVIELVDKTFPQHSRLMFNLLCEAWKDGALRQDISPMQIFAAVIPGVFAHALWRERVFPFSLTDLGDEIPPLPDDAVEAAMQNFTCLIQGFLASPPAETEHGQSPENGGEGVATAAPKGRGGAPPQSSTSRKDGQRSGSTSRGT